jgi:PEP-CTERM motif
MRKSFWIILAVLGVAIGAPNALAESFTPTFTCTGTCSSTPTAPDVVFPQPTTLQPTWFSTLLPPIPFLPSGQLPADKYVWSAAVLCNALTCLGFFGFTDVTNNTINSSNFQVLCPCAFPLAGADSGTLSFAAVSTPVPEPGTADLMLMGIGLLLLVLVMRRRIAQGLPQAT